MVDLRTVSLFFLVALSYHSVTTAIDTFDCTLLSHLPCRATYQEVDCRTWPPDDSFFKPASPAGLQVEGPTLTTRSKLPYDLTISWGPPRDGSINYLKGFNLLLSQLSNPVGPSGCIEYDLSNATWKDGDAGIVRYSYTFMLDGGTQVQATVKSLPLNKHDNSIVSETIDIPGDRERASWKTNISLDKVYDESVSFSFSLAPESYAFDIYYIMLYNCTDDYCRYDRLELDEFDASQNGDSGIVIRQYNNLPPGEYQIAVKPEKRKDIDGEEVCLCNDYDFCQCSESSSERFEMPGAALTGPLTGGENSNYSKIAVIVVALIVLVVLAVGLTLKLTSHFVPCWPGKKIVIIASSSHQTPDTKRVLTHKKVLSELKAYLESIGCHVRVFSEECLPRTSQLMRADDVVMICCSMTIQQQVMDIDSEGLTNKNFNDAFLRTYAFVVENCIENDGRPKCCLLYLPYLPYPESAHQLPVIDKNEFCELDKFIFGEPLDEKQEINKAFPSVCLERSCDRFNKINLAIESVEHQQIPIAEPGQSVGVGDIEKNGGPGSCDSWFTKAPTEDTFSVEFPISNGHGHLVW